MLTLYDGLRSSTSSFFRAHPHTPRPKLTLSPCTPSSCSLQSLSAIPHHPPRSMLVKRLDARALAFLPSRFFLNRVVLSLLSNFHDGKGKRFLQKSSEGSRLFSLFFSFFLSFFLSFLLSFFHSSCKEYRIQTTNNLNSRYCAPPPVLLVLCCKG